MSISRNDVKLCKYYKSRRSILIVFLASFPVGESGANVTTIAFGHYSGKLLATGSEDSTIHIYLFDQMTSLLVRICFCFLLLI
jgi:WD40 repeat protein